MTHLRDAFGQQRLREGKYTAGQIDAEWSKPIGHLPVAREQVEIILKQRSR
jgi:hypothetical protein